MKTLDELKKQAIALREEANAFKETITGGTREQWDAWDDLDASARFLWSAAVNLEKHEFRTGGIK